MKPVRFGSRRSALAQTQTNAVIARLRRAFPDLPIELVLISTRGDQESSSPTAASGGSTFDVNLDPRPAPAGDDVLKGGLKTLFTKELEDALLEGRIDLAVHSLKDMAAELPEGLVIGAVPEREDPRDAWISRDSTRFSALKPGARIGTGAVRRQAQILHVRPDLELVPLRGNVETRLKKLNESPLDGIILALAGLKRLGQAGAVTEILSTELLLPAVGQGALAIEARAGDAQAAPYLAALNHAPSHEQAEAERAFLKKLGGSCQTPVAGCALHEGATLVMHGRVLSPNGKEDLREMEKGSAQDARGVGERLAAKLLARGAEKLLS